MLTLRRIERIQKPLMPKTAGEIFAEKILGNYEFIWLHVTAGELLHAVLSVGQPEETNHQESSLLVQNIQIRQQACLDIVNQLVNRFQELVQGKTDYRNQVFIEASLRKLGIHNRQEFMKMLIDASRTGIARQELVRIERENTGHLKSLYRILEDKKPWWWKRKKGKQEEKQKEPSPDMAQLVLKRLKLAEAGSGLGELRSPLAGRESRPGEEFTTVMQNLEFADNLTAMQLHETALIFAEKELYQIWNPYEKWTSREEMVSKEALESSLVSAILFHLVRDTSVYAQRRAGMKTGIHRVFWMNLKEAVGKESKRSTERFFFYHRAMQTADMENQKVLLEVIQDGFAKEIRILRHIRELSQPDKSGEDAKELRRTKQMLKEVLNRHKDVLEEELFEQSSRAVHVMSRMEEEIRRYLYYTELHHIDSYPKAVIMPQELVHVYPSKAAQKEAEGQTGADISARRTMRQEVSFQNQAHKEQKNIHLELAQKSQKEVNRLVKNHIKEQMNVLTDQVYSRLESKLYSEKKRRGM